MSLVGKTYDIDNPVVGLEKWSNKHIYPDDWERDNTGKANVGQPTSFRVEEATQWYAYIRYLDGSVVLRDFDSPQARAEWLEPFIQQKDEYYREVWNQ